MEKEIDDFIGIFDNVISKEECDEIITFFNRIQSLGKTVTRKEHENIAPTLKDNSLYLWLNETDPLTIVPSSQIMESFVRAIDVCYFEYSKKYGTLESLSKHILNPDLKIQKTLPGEGYHMWHCEQSARPYGGRLLLCMLYLNSVYDGGETEFYYQKRKIKPVKGKTIIWPTDFTHLHRGVTSPTEHKIIATGWFNYFDVIDMDRYYNDIGLFPPKN